MKPGANNQERNQIKRLAEQGLIDEEISLRLLIDKDCVAGFIKHFGIEIEEVEVADVIGADPDLNFDADADEE